MTKTLHFILTFTLFIGLTACQISPSGSTLFDELGGMPGIKKITDGFIYEIGLDRNVVTHFSETDLDRFRKKFIEQICEISDGPCQYSGDTMLQVHKKMNISEAEFNRTVDLLIAAMNQSGIAHSTQNKLLSKLVPMRPDIIYQ